MTKSENVPYILLFGFFSLVAILIALVVMFHRNAPFLLAQREDLLSIEILHCLQTEAARNNPKLFAVMLQHMTPRGLLGNVEADSVESTESDKEEGMIDLGKEDDDEDIEPIESIDENQVASTEEKNALNSELERLRGELNSKQ
jgi:hypothetical protein